MHLWSRNTAHSGTPGPVPGPGTGQGFGAPTHAIRGWTETGSLIAFVRGWDRPSDILNRREPVLVEDVRAFDPTTGSSPLSVGGTRYIDPFEFDLLLLADLPEPVAERSAARRVHKVRYRVEAVGGEFRVLGVLHLFPGQAPEMVHHRLPALFVPLTEPLVHWRGHRVSNPARDVALINRHLIASIRQVDWVRLSDA